MFLYLSTGGADQIRTGDLMLAKHALSQLSYCPMPLLRKGNLKSQITNNKLMFVIWNLSFVISSFLTTSENWWWARLESNQ